MSDSSVGRRAVLRHAGVAAGGTVLAGAALASPAAAHGDRDHHHDDDVTGSWLVDVHNDDGSESRSVASFADGGVCIIHDISPAGPPFTGTWQSGRHDSFRATVLTGTAGEGGPGSAGVVIELKLRGSAHHDRVSGSFTFTVSDADGNNVGTGSGTFDGSRIEA